MLELDAVADEGGRTVLRHRRASPPFFVSKPYDRGGALQVQLQQVGPGLLGGDVSDARVSVGPGAALILTSPSAQRLLPRGERESVSRQEFAVARGGRLEVWPEPLFPHRGARARLDSRLVVEPGAALLWFEALAPGRDAAGERHAWDSLDLRTSVHDGGRPLLVERFAASGREWAELSAAFPKAGTWTGLFLAYGEPAEEIRRALASWEGEAAVGVTSPAPNLLVVKFMSADGHGVRALKAALQSASGSLVAA
jgi:urease accessory protein